MKNCQTARLASFLSAALLMFSLTVHSMPASAAESAQNSEEKAMNRMQRAEKNRQKFLGEAQSPLARTDPELIAMKERLLYGEIVGRGTLNDRQRMLVTLVALAASQTLFCFGDMYTRGGLDLKTRELLTFCIISALGGCEAQVRAHAQGNANVGNSKQNLIDALAQMLPYIGFPRTLNALGCVNAVLRDC